MDNNFWYAICAFCFMVGLIAGISLGRHAELPATSETKTVVITIEGKDYSIKEKS